MAHWGLSYASGPNYNMPWELHDQEGRASALILTSAPFIVMGAMHMLTPDFYGSVIHEKMVQYGLGACLLWMVIGNLVMRKMINFKV